MTPNNMFIVLNDFLSLLAQFELVSHVQWPKQYKIRHDTGYILRMTWMSDEGSIIYGNFASVEEYGNILRRGQYTAVLYDGGIIQIGYDFLKNEVIGHRLAYYPWPFHEYDKELFMDSPPDLYEIYISEKIPLRLNTPIRFDYSVKEQNMKSHLHFNYENVRLAVSKPLGLGQFLHFIFRNFYPDDWEKYDFLRDIKPVSLGDEYSCIATDDAKYIHLLCP